MNNKYKTIYLQIGDWGLGIGDWGLGPIPNHFFKSLKAL
jgi:hypothetical protein